RERMKWLTIVIITNLFTLLLMLPSEDASIVPSKQWPESWVEISINAEIVATPQTMVTVLNQHSQVVFPQAFLLTKAKECSSFNQGTQARLMVPANELTKLKNNFTYKALPYSEEFAVAKPLSHKVNYEVHF